MRVLIVGAGPTGLTAAVELARHGIIADVIDRKDQASQLSRAVGIIPRSLELLTPSGVTRRLLKEGIKLSAIEAYFEQRRLATIPLSGSDDRYDFILALAQNRTEAALGDALVRYGGMVRYGVEFSSLQQIENKVIVDTSHGRNNRYDYVIGADGSGSTVRQALGIEFAGFDLPGTWSIADVDAINWANVDKFTVCLLSDGQVVVVAPLEAQRYRVISNTQDALAALPLALEITKIRRQAQFQIPIRQVAQYGLGRVYLAGDAAHCHSPVGGRGMNLGIADAAELAAKIVDDDLADYSESRHAEGAATIAMSERARRILTSPSPFNNRLLRLALAIGDKSVWVKRRIARTILGS